MGMNGIDYVELSDRYSDQQSQVLCPVCGKNRYEHVANIPLLNKVLDQIRSDPSSWYQSSWITTIRPGSYLGQKVYDPDEDVIKIDHAKVNVINECKTAYCFAGHAVILSGWHSVIDDFVVRDGMADTIDNAVHIEMAAACELGITPDWAEALFEGDNSFRTVRDVVQNIIHEAEAKL